MKKSLIIFLSIIAVLVLIPLIFFSLMGYVPGLSTVFGADKPEDLGVTYTEADFNSAHQKSAIVYETLPPSTADNASIQFSGSHQTDTSWNSAEMTALLNNRPWKYWPISNVQMRINADNTVEMTGIINSDKLRGYAAGIQVPSAVSDRISLLPTEAAFYLKGTAALSENNVSKFDITGAKLGKISIPANILLSGLTTDLVNTALADDLTSELSQYSGKKAYIVDFINGRLDWVSGFFANSAYFSDQKLYFKGTVPDKELTVQ